MAQEAQQLSLVPSAGPNIPKMIRKKTPGACERCREKRIKCDGLQPCDQCTKKSHKCTFTFGPSTGNEALTEKLDLVLSRLDRIEASMEQRDLASILGKRPFTVISKNVAQNRSPQLTSVAQLNPQTGCFEHYGSTSTFVLASSLSKRIRQLEEGSELSSPKRLCPPRRRHSIDASPGSVSQSSENLGLDELPAFYDYVMPANAPFRQHRSLQRDVADRHLASFFRTIHIFLPLFDESNFRERYTMVRSLFGDHRLFVPTQQNPNQQQFLCLLYAVFALGALYEDEREDSSSWASWYFAEAQEMLGRLMDAVNLELVQAAMLMGAYAQHAIKPNLAYNLAGISTRLAFSIGLNVESTYGSSGFDAEEARRTWWLIYVQEVELSLDSGRPMSIRSCDVNTTYPLNNGADGSSHDETSQVTFIRCLAEIAKIILKILKLVNHTEVPEDPILTSHALMGALMDDLLRWRESLPTHLRFQEDYLDSESQPESVLSWQARQRSSLRIHYNLAVIISYRGWPNKQAEDFNAASDDDSHKTSALDAARDMILHIHQLFTLAPSLRRWSYYCFYCLQATLVLLMKSTDEPYAEGIENLKSLCELSIQIFEQIELKAAKRCAEIVRHVLDQGEERAGAWASNGNNTWTPEERRAAQSQRRPSQDIPNWLAGPSSSSQSATGNRLPRPQDGLPFDTYTSAGPSDIPKTADAPDADADADVDPSNDENLWFPFYLAGEDWPLQALQGFPNFSS